MQLAIAKAESWRHWKPLPWFFRHDGAWCVAWLAWCIALWFDDDE